MAPGGPYVTPAGDQVADDLADMTDGSLDSPIDDDENGTAVVGNREVWTSTGTNGLATSFDCLNWTNGTSAEYATVGIVTYTDSRWTNIYPQFCNRINPSLYCVQQ